MAETPKLVSSMGKAELDRIFVRGYDLNEQLLGKITFAQMVYLMLVGRMPSTEEGRMIDTMLIVLVDHSRWDRHEQRIGRAHDLPFGAGGPPGRSGRGHSRCRERPPRLVGILRQDAE